MAKNVKIVCITGFPCSGKTTASKFFNKKGFRLIEIGSIARNLAKKQKEEVLDFSIKIRKRYGKGAYGKFVADIIKKYMQKNERLFVISGVRSYEEVKKFNNLGKVFIIFITAPAELRWKRCKKRKRMQDFSFQNFKRRERVEGKFGLNEIINKSDFIVSNSSTKKELLKNLKEVLSKIK